MKLVFLSLFVATSSFATGLVNGTLSPTPGSGTNGGGQTVTAGVNVTTTTNGNTVTVNANATSGVFSNIVSGTNITIVPSGGNAGANLSGTVAVNLGGTGTNTSRGTGQYLSGALQMSPVGGNNQDADMYAATSLFEGQLGLSYSGAKWMNLWAAGAAGLGTNAWGAPIAIPGGVVNIGQSWNTNKFATTANTTVYLGGGYYGSRFTNAWPNGTNSGVADNYFRIINGNPFTTGGSLGIMSTTTNVTNFAGGSYSTIVGTNQDGVVVRQMDPFGLALVWTPDDFLFPEIDQAGTMAILTGIGPWDLGIGGNYLISGESVVHQHSTIYSYNSESTRIDGYGHPGHWHVGMPLMIANVTTPTNALFKWSFSTDIITGDWEATNGAGSINALSSRDTNFGATIFGKVPFDEEGGNFNVNGNSFIFAGPHNATYSALTMDNGGFSNHRLGLCYNFATGGPYIGYDAVPFQICFDSQDLQTMGVHTPAPVLTIDTSKHVGITNTLTVNLGVIDLGPVTNRMAVFINNTISNGPSGTDGQTIVYDAATPGGFKSTNFPSGGGGGSQTPWAQTIDGGGFALTNTSQIIVSNINATTTSNQVNINPNSTNVINVAMNLAANATSNAFTVTNINIASSGNQMFSPAIHQAGQGWKTTATAASQPVDMIQYLKPVQGTANPTSQLNWDFGVNNGAYANGMNLSSAGDLTVTRFGTFGSTVTSSGNFSGLNFIANVAGQYGFNGRSFMASPADGSIVFKNAASSAIAGIVGTTAADSPAAGNLGELISATVASSSAVALTTATALNVTSIVLSAGDWDVEGNVNYVTTTATVTGSVAGLSTTTITLPNDGTEVYSGVQLVTTSATDGISLPRKRINVSGSTTVYLVAKSTFSVGNVSAFGSISARRIR